MKIHRRSFLALGATALAFAAATALWPARVFAQWTRPEGAFKAKDMAGTYAALGGTPEPSGDITFLSPEIAENGAVVPVSVTSKIPGTEQIAILVELNPNPLSALFMLPEGAEPSISTRVKVGQTSRLHALVKAKGKWYSATRETKVTLGGCGG